MLAAACRWTDTRGRSELRRQKAGITICGITGILRVSNGFATDEETLLAMRDSMVHRGPDDGGTWHSEDGRVALAHRRLSIVDLSKAGHQPMSNEDGTIW